MDTPKFTAARAGLLDLMDDLAVDIARRYDAGGFTASGRLKRSLSSGVAGDRNQLTATLYAAQYYRYVANGRPPGKMPPPSELAEWALIKGIASSEEEARRIGWGIAMNIAKFGSKGFREKRPNTAEEAIDDFQPRIDKLLSDILANDIEATNASLFRNLNSRA